MTTATLPPITPTPVPSPRPSTPTSRRSHKTSNRQVVNTRANSLGNTAAEADRLADTALAADRMADGPANIVFAAHCMANRLANAAELAAGLADSHPGGRPGCPRLDRYPSPDARATVQVANAGAEYPSATLAPIP